MTWRSINGYFIKLCNAPTSWKSIKYQVVPKSSVKAEYRSMENVTSEVMWLRKLVRFLGIKLEVAQLYCDSKSELYTAANPILHE